MHCFITHYSFFQAVHFVVKYPFSSSSCLSYPALHWRTKPTSPKCIYVRETRGSMQRRFYVALICCNLTHHSQWKINEWNQPLPHSATQHHTRHKTKNWWPSHTHRATWEQWIHVLQTQSCLAAVIQNLQQKGEDYPGRAVGRAVGSCG